MTFPSALSMVALETWSAGGRAGVEAAQEGGEGLGPSVPAVEVSEVGLGGGSLCDRMWGEGTCSLQKLTPRRLWQGPSSGRLNRGDREGSAYLDDLGV